MTNTLILKIIGRRDWLLSILRSRKTRVCGIMAQYTDVQTWRSLPCRRDQLRLDVTLAGGQSFRWNETSPGHWTGVMSGCVWTLTQTDSEVLYRVYRAAPKLCLSGSLFGPRVSVKNEVNLDIKCPGSNVLFERDGRRADLKVCSDLSSKDVITNTKVVVERRSTRRQSSQEMLPAVPPKRTRETGGKLGGSTSDAGRNHKEFGTTDILLKTENFDGDDCIHGKPLNDSSNDSEDSVLGKSAPAVLGVCKNEVSNVDTDVRQMRQISDKSHDEAVLRDYLHLDLDLDDLYTHWSSVDANFYKKAAMFRGVRLLRQDPVENLFSFICSSNNNISRISSMVEKMCVQYGALITQGDGKAYYSFPSIASLAADNVEQTLRDLGFGYRAKYICTTARYICTQENGDQWLHGLRQASYTDAKMQLMKLHGVGAKVADCVCLMSLDKMAAIPVDTHVWQIAVRDYTIAGLRQTKSLTDSVYDYIGDYFRSLWGPYAGWTQSVLFSAELKRFQAVSQPSELVKSDKSNQIVNRRHKSTKKIKKKH